MDSQNGPKLNELLSAFNQSGDYCIRFEALLKRVDVKDLETSTRALVLGPGQGIREIKFLTSLVPSLREVTFVEPDEHCLEELKKGLAEAFEPAVETHVHQCLMQEWHSETPKFDLVLMFHCLYQFGEKQRRAILAKCFEQWLLPNGLLFITMIDDTFQAQNEGPFTSTVYRELGMSAETEINDIKRDLEALGKTYEEYPFVVLKNMDAITPGIVAFLRYYSPQATTDEAVVGAIDAIKKKGYRGVSFDNLCVVRNSC